MHPRARTMRTTTRLAHTPIAAGRTPAGRASRLRQLGALAILSCGGIAHADDALGLQPESAAAAPQASQPPDPAAQPDLPAQDAPADPLSLDPEGEALPLFDVPKPFGAQGTRWAVFGGGIALDGNDATDFSGFAQASWFIVDDVELGGELAIWNFDQTGQDAVGGSISALVRWHFVNEGRLSLFIDGGIGLLGATDAVPEGGTDFNFLPRAGIGGTWRPWDSDLRLLMGLRWHHISNARSSGAEDNPSRDGAMLYVGLGVPF